MLAVHVAGPVILAALAEEAHGHANYWTVRAMMPDSDPGAKPWCEEMALKWSQIHMELDSLSDRLTAGGLVEPCQMIPFMKDPETPFDDSPESPSPTRRGPVSVSGHRRAVPRLQSQDTASSADGIKTQNTSSPATSAEDSATPSAPSAPPTSADDATPLTSLDV